MLWIVVHGSVLKLKTWSLLGLEVQQKHCNEHHALFFHGLWKFLAFNLRRGGPRHQPLPPPPLYKASNDWVMFTYVFSCTCFVENGNFFLIKHCFKSFRRFFCSFSICSENFIAKKMTFPLNVTPNLRLRLQILFFMTTTLILIFLLSRGS